MMTFLLHPHFASRAVVLALLLGLGWALLPPRTTEAKFQSRAIQTAANWTRSAGGSNEEILVLYRNERGETTCREATRTERELINSRRSGAGPTRIIYSGAPRDPEKAQSETGLNLLPSAGLRIVLHGTTQLEQNQQAKDAFIIAANRWEAIISTPITIVIDVDFGPTFFGTPYPNPGILGATGTDFATGPFSDLRQRLINGASGSGETELYNALPATELPIEINDVTSTVTNARATAANARALGLIPDITNPDSLPLGQGDAGIGFNSAFQFDFTPDDGIGANLTDFDAVAVHEIGHALGFVSNAGGNTTVVSVWDLFRFKPARATLATFGTTPRVMQIGGSQVFFGNQTTTYATLELDLSTGGPSPGPGDGDGRQSSHWRDDTNISTRQYIGIMDPTLARGLRRTISENDILALNLFGYSIGGPAPVRPPNDNFASAAAMTSGAGSISGTNVDATREPGEPIHAFFLSDKSIWYSWVAPHNGQATVDTIGSNFDTTLSIYTGSILNQLGQIASNDDIVSGSNKASRVQFNLAAGETYRIAVDGWNSESGNVTLNWTSIETTPTPTPTPTPSPSPTPTPPADLQIDAFTAAPGQAAADQLVSLVVQFRNLGPGTATNIQATMVLPSGLSFVNCSPTCFPPAGANGGTVVASLGTLPPGAAGSFTTTAEVTAAVGATLNVTANVSSSIEDPTSANNSASASITVVELVRFTEAKKISLDSQGHHVLALRRGTVWAWGDNFYGQLGDGTHVHRQTPGQVDDLMSVVDVAAGGHYSIALKSDGTVWGWGSNELGQAGIGTVTPTKVTRPTKIANLSSVIAIAAGSSHVLALKSDGTVWVWGANGIGELGLGTTDFAPHPTPTQIPGLTNIARIFAGSSVSFAVRADGTVFGWGTSFVGKLGDGASGTPSVVSPKELPALKGMIDASTGVSSTIVVKPDGSVLTFGMNIRGQLGRGLPDNGPYPIPTQIAGLSGKRVSNGDGQVIVIEPSGTLKAFGRNDSGELGIRSSDLLPHPTPLSVPGISSAFVTVTGTGSTLALVGDPVTGGTIEGWGANLNGVLGIGSNFPSVVSVSVIENLTVATPIFSLPAGTTIPAQVQIVCGTPGAVIRYTTNGSDPTESDPIVTSGSFVSVGQSMTLKARAFRANFAASAVKSASYTVVAAPQPVLLVDQAGPALDQAAALDLYTLTRDPFSVFSVNDYLHLGSDQNTRVIVFVRDLPLVEGEPPSAIVVNLVGSNSQSFDVPAEDVRAVANLGFLQVSFRLPDALAPGTCTIRIKAHAQVSNAGTMRIKP